MAALLYGGAAVAGLCPAKSDSASRAGARFFLGGGGGCVMTGGNSDDDERV